MDFSEKYYRPYLKTLDELGFCTLPLLADGKILSLGQLYEDKFGNSVGKGLHATHNSSPAEHALAVSEEIKAIVNDAVKGILPDYEYFIGHYMVKGAQSPDEFRLHQDWNIVDESHYNTYQIWIPLKLTYPMNGGLFVVPGSHKFFGNYRSGSYDIPRISYDQNIARATTDIIVPPGNAIIYHNALFHGSYPNKTDEERVAVIVNYRQKSAQTYYFHRNAANRTTDLYDIDAAALIGNLPRLEKNEIPSLPFVGQLPFSEIINESIGSNDILREFKSRFGDIPATQIKQLHVTKDRGLEDKLNSDGFAVVDLLGYETVNKLRAKYNEHFGDLDRAPGRFTTLQHTNIATRNLMHEYIVGQMESPLSLYFEDFVIPVSQFYTKKAHTSGDIDLHADSTLLLNHQLEPHYAIWIPLQDVDSNSGTLTVIPRSHLFRNAFFSGSLGGYHSEHMDWLRQFELPMTLKAGQAVIFDNNLLHNSTANKTDADRICITFRMTHCASSYYSFVSKAENDIELWEEKPDYYMTTEWDGESEVSTGRYMGEMKNSRIRRGRDELKEILERQESGDIL